MSRVVHKYPLPHPGTDALYSMGAPFKPVHVGTDPNGVLCAWFEHEPTTVPLAKVRLFLVGTGHPVPWPGDHAGSFVADMFVWHVYFTRV